MTDQCSTCHFGKGYPTDEGVEMHCHRHSPLITGGLHTPTETVWPLVNPDDWCGDYTPATPPF